MDTGRERSLGKPITLGLPNIVRNSLERGLDSQFKLVFRAGADVRLPAFL